MKDVVEDKSPRISISTPARGEAGRTGDWRSKRPVLDASKCLTAKRGEVTCQICWAYCPDACITRAAPPSVDLEYCKGCGICAEECPTGAIEMEPEEVHGVCAMPSADDEGEAGR